MKAKKLTEREWYLCAQWWSAEIAVPPTKLRLTWDIVTQAAGEARKFTGAKNLDDLDYRSSYGCISQYCLERAGIPAGDR